MLKRSEKEAMVEDLSRLFQESDNIFVTDYLGLDVSKITDLRKQLREKNIKYRVAKNSLLKIAAEKTGFENITEHFTGPTAIAFGVEDPTAPAKTIYEFSKKNGKPEVKVFFADGRVFNADELKALAELPTKDELIARLIGVISGPLTSLVGTLDGVIREFCVTIDQIAQSKEN